ncbi:putative RNase H-like HicB family nuclease [Oxalobacteraceae bacterium GrIS 2.11]
MNIPIIIHKESASVYGVTVPDIPGCFSSGENIDQAIQNTKDAIYSHVELLFESNEPISISPSAIDTLLDNPDYHGGIWMLVDVDVNKLDPTPARINVSVPRFILSKIDSFLEHDQHGRQHESRSGFLARAALKVIAEESPNAIT